MTNAEFAIVLAEMDRFRELKVEIKKNIYKLDSNVMKDLSSELLRD